MFSGWAKGGKGGCSTASGERGSIPWACAPAGRNTLICFTGDRGGSPEGSGWGPSTLCRQRSHEPAGPLLLEKRNVAAAKPWAPPSKACRVHPCLRGALFWGDFESLGGNRQVVSWWVWGWRDASGTRASLTSLLTEKDGRADCLRDTRRQVGLLPRDPC